MSDALILSLAVALHLLASVVWVGGMFFAYLVLRPAARPLASGLRLLLWRRVFARFLPWVWASVIAILASGYGVVFGIRGGLGAVGLHVHLMQATGLVMVAVFLYLFFGPWQQFRRAVDADDPTLAGRELERIRRLVLTNLVLGLLTVLIGGTGRYW